MSFLPYLFGHHGREGVPTDVAGGTLANLLAPRTPVTRKRLRGVEILDKSEVGELLVATSVQRRL
jgi:hypothetical protein